MESILQWNIRGLKSNSFHKTKKCIAKLENVQSTLLFNLQETHLRCDEEIPKKLKNMDHLYHILSTHATEDDKGAGILLFVNKTEEIIDTEILYPGRLLFAKIRNRTTSQTKNVFSFYGKSHTSKQEIRRILKMIEDKVSDGDLEGILILGDFNFVTSLNDRNSSAFNSVDNNYRHDWEKLQVNLSLIDTFRVTNPKKRLYTYSHTNGTSAARLDRVYLSNDSIGKIVSNKFEYSSESDHRIVILKLAKNVDIGPGQWIFNNTLLTDEIFVNQIQEVINSFNENKHNFPSNRSLWEFLKQNLSCVSKSYSIRKSAKERSKIEEVRYNLEVLESININDRTESVEKVLNELKNFEKEYISKRIQGTLLRSKLPGVDEGDLNLAYYTKLEKLKAEQNTIYSLENNDGMLVEGTEQILDVTHAFYKDLYSKEPEDTDLQDEFLSNLSIKLSEEDKAKLDEDFSKEELQDALKDLKRNKSPGSDGLTKEFFDHFWPSLEDFYFDCISEIELEGELTESQRLGLIRISYKKDGRIYIKNYRPITLLNVDLKVLTRTLAKRMVTVLPKLIHENQTCIPGRRITKNIHIVQDLIDLINKNNGKGAFIFLDQEKAFDRISHTFMLKTLRAFGFGDRFVNWVKIVYTNTRSAVKVNGHLTSEFSIQRGVRQGCPLSALLYVLCAEVLGVAIRANSSIKGFKFNRNNEHKISQYADDMTAYISTIDSLKELFNLLGKYERATNAKLNVTKTEGLWIGEWEGRDDRPLNLKWTNSSVKFTGILVGNDRCQCSRQGFASVLEKIVTKMSYWKSKFLSLKGRIKVLNIFVLSKFWYCLECQDFPKDLKKDLENLLSSFIWKDIHQRSLDVLYCDYGDGGLRLQSPEVKQNALRIRWLSDVMQSDENSIERFLVNNLISTHQKIKGLKVLSSVNHDKEISNTFYKNAVNSYRLMKVKYYPKDMNSIRRDWIYDNQYLLDADGKPFKPPSCFPPYAPEFICDLPVYNHPREFSMRYRNLIPKLNLALRRIVYSNSDKNEYRVQIGKNETDLFKTSFKEVYAELMRTRKKPANIWVEKWENDLGIKSEEWEGIWRNVHCHMLSPYVQSTVWETLHRNYMCAYFAQIAFNESNICMLCGSPQNKRTHIFIECEVISECYSHYLSFTDLLVDIGSVNLLEKSFGLKIEKEDSKQKLRNYINFSIRHVVFRNRHRKLGNNRAVTVRNLIRKIDSFLKGDLKTKFNLALEKHSLDEFRNTYLVDGILGSADNKVLTLNNLY